MKALISWLVLASNQADVICANLLNYNSPTSLM